MKRHPKKRRATTTPTSELPPTVEDYAAATERGRRWNAERERLAEVKPLTTREAAGVLAGLRRLAYLAAKGVPR